MTEPPQSAQKSFVEGQADGDQVGPLTGESRAPASLPRAELSGAVGSALGIGTAPVSAGALIDLILAQHEHDYLKGRRSLVPTWPEQGARQPPARWESDIRRVLTTEHEIFGRTTIIALCLLDPQLSAVAQASGFLGAIADETTPSISLYLSDHGRSMLRRRAPLVALATQELPPDAEHRFGVEPVRMIAIARQTGLASGVVGRWAAVSGGTVWEGNAATVREVAIPEPLALGWRGDLLVAFSVVDGQGYFWENGSPPRGNVTDVPDRTGIAAVVGDGADALIADDGRIYAGPGYVQRVGGSGYSSYRTLAAVPDGTMPRVAAVTAGNELHVYTDEEVNAPRWQLPARATSRVAANTEYLYVNSGNGDLSGYAWAEGKDAAPPPAHQMARRVSKAFDHWAAGGRLLVASFSSTVYVYDGTQHVATRHFDDLVTAVEVSPDGRAIGVATADGTVRLWRVDPPSELLLTSYTNDAATGDDLLGIAPAVDALATLMCAKQVLPPLSIGLFGAWGSGKSFFMEKLQDRVTTITDDARAPGAPPQHALWTWRNIRQIRFNAWHYSSVEVWSGLLDQLLRDLASTSVATLTRLPQKLDALQRERIELLRATEKDQESAAEELKAARAEVTTTETREAAARTALQEAEQALKSPDVTAVEAVRDEQVRASAERAMEAVGMEHAVNTAADTLTQLAEARRRVDVVRELVDGPERTRLLLALLAGPLAAVVLAVVVWLVKPQLSGVVAAVGGITAALVALNIVLRRGIAAVDDKLALIAAAEDKARAAVEKRRERVEQAEKAHRDATRAAHTAELAAEQARVALAEAAERVRTATRGSLLEEYLARRSGSADYRSQLGIIGTVRSDLQVISDSIGLHNADVDDSEVSTVDDVVNRVILYVDDLDRCPPHVVVKVLEAVHLLLSYPLFVVVVAVDAHWVSRSLATVYPTMLSGGEVTPDSYLEKIFQLPVWLDSPDGPAAADMLRALFDPAPGPATVRQEPAADVPAAASSESTEADPAPTGPRRPATAVPTGGLATTTPRALQEVEGEADAVAALAPLLSRSPRALKRFLNTYRLLKVVVTESDELARARLLLAIATGRPDLGERLLNQILDRKGTTDTIRDLMTNWRSEDREWLAARVPEEPDWTAYSTAAAAAEVRRFVYRTSVNTEKGPEKNAGRP